MQGVIPGEVRFRFRKKGKQPWLREQRARARFGLQGLGKARAETRIGRGWLREAPVRERVGCFFLGSPPKYKRVGDGLTNSFHMSRSGGKERKATRVIYPGDWLRLAEHDGQRAARRTRGQGARRKASSANQGWKRVSDVSVEREGRIAIVRFDTRPGRGAFLTFDPRCRTISLTRKGVQHLRIAAFGADRGLCPL